MYCDQCGTKVKVESASFCHQCGNPLDEAFDPAGPSGAFASAGMIAKPATQAAPQILRPVPPQGITQPSPQARKPAPKKQAKGKASTTLVISHWSTLIEGLQASPLDFYASVEDAVARRRVPEITIYRVDWPEGGIFSAKREYLRVSRKRHVIDICGAPFGNAFFCSWWLAKVPSENLWALLGLILAFPFVLFISTRVFGLFFAFLILALTGIPLFLLFLLFLGYLLSHEIIPGEDAVLELPVIGPLYERIFQPNTYYKIDTALMFRGAVHNAVLEVVDEITKAKGIRALSELERKPIMKEFLSR